MSPCLFNGLMDGAAVREMRRCVIGVEMSPGGTEWKLPHVVSANGAVLLVDVGEESGRMVDRFEGV